MLMCYTFSILEITFQHRLNLAKIKLKQTAFFHKKEKLRGSLMVDGKLLTKERTSILSLPILDLSAKLKRGALMPLEVLEAYQVITIFFDVEVLKSQIKTNSALGNK